MDRFTRSVFAVCAAATVFGVPPKAFARHPSPPLSEPEIWAKDGIVITSQYKGRIFAIHILNCEPGKQLSMLDINGPSYSAHIPPEKTSWTIEMASALDTATVHLPVAISSLQMPELSADKLCGKDGQPNQPLVTDAVERILRRASFHPK